MMQQPYTRTRCEKCGRVTLTFLLSDVQLRMYDLEDGRPMYVTLCPEHRAELVRLLSDFLEPGEPVDPPADVSGEPCDQWLWWDGSPAAPCIHRLGHTNRHTPRVNPERLTAATLIEWGTNR